MAVRAFDWRIAIRDSQLEPTTKLVLYNLSTYLSNEGNGMFPSLDTQADGTGLSKRSVQDHIGKAIDAGYLRKHKAGLQGKKWAHNKYFPTFPTSVIEQALIDSTREDFDHRIANDPDSQRVAAGASARNATVANGNTNGVNQLPPNHSTESLINKNTKKKPRKLVSLEEWETEKGSPLCLQMLTSWIRTKGYDPKLISDMVEEFRTRMMASDNRYADYRAAFQDWFGRGFLSKKPEQCKLVSNPSRRASISI